MADFSENATQLSAPQGAGSAPIAPVQSNILGNGVSDVISNTLSIFAKGMGLETKDKGKEAQNAVVNSYAQRLGSLTSALESGQVPPGEASARARSLHNQYIAGFGQYADDFEKVRSTVFKGTSLGVVEDEEKAATASWNKAKDAAIVDGFPITGNMDKRTQETLVSLHQQQVRTNAELKTLYSSNEEKRASGRYDREIVDRETRDKELSLVTNAADNALTTSETLLQSMVDRMKAGGNTQELATEWASWMSRVDGQIQAAAGTNPQLASGYRSVFDSLRTQGNKMFEPGADTNTLENEFKKVMLQSKLQLVADPQFRTVVASSQLLGSNAELALKATPIVSQAISKVIGVDPSGRAPNVIGDPTLEKPVMQFLKSSLDQYSAGTFKDGEKAKTELSTGIRTTLRQASEAINREGFKSSDLKAAADLIASPSYGKFVAENPIDPATNALADQVFSQFYEKNVVQGVNQKLNETFNFNTLTKADPSAPRGDTVTQQTRSLDISNVNVKFTGTSVVFDLKALPADPADRSFAMRKMEETKPYQDALGRMVRIRAHMAGSTNYEKYWEDNKHMFLPQMFSKYKNLEVGQKVNGFVYTGGDANDARNWKQSD